jgi:hypothetical protein
MYVLILIFCRVVLLLEAFSTHLHVTGCITKAPEGGPSSGSKKVVQINVKKSLRPSN